MGVGGRAEGGFAARTAVEVDGGTFAEHDLVEGGEFHEEIVRVLAVDDGDAVGGFAGGEEQRVALAGNGGGFGAEHGAEGEGAGSGAVRRGEHDPVGGEDLVAAARAGLIGVHAEELAAGGERPATEEG